MHDATMPKLAINSFPSQDFSQHLSEFQSITSHFPESGQIPGHFQVTTGHFQADFSLQQIHKLDQVSREMSMDPKAVPIQIQTCHF